MVDGLHCKAVNPINCLPCHSNESIIQAFLPNAVIARPATQGVCVLCRNALYNPAQLPTVFPVLLAVRLILSTNPTTLAAGQTLLEKNTTLVLTYLAVPKNSSEVIIVQGISFNAGKS